MSDGFAFGFEIGDLAADHSAVRAGGLRDHRQNRHAPLRFNGSHRQRLKSQSQQRVARQNGDRLAEDFMIGGFAAAKIVVIECGKIIVNQRIGVNEFERAADVHRASLFGGKHSRGFQAQNRDEYACRRRRRCSA